jgi:hypothetical protein
MKQPANMASSETSWSDRPGGWWRATAVIELPDGTTRHPRLPEAVQRHLDRPSVLDLQSSGVLVAFALRSTVRVEAQQEADDVAAGLLEYLQLPFEALVELELNPPEQQAHLSLT